MIKEYKDNVLNESIYFSESDNGIKVYYMPKENYNKQYAIFSTNYGSIDNKFIPIGENKEIEVPEGIAHFLEHKLFEEKDGNNIFDEYSKLGTDVNAFTSFTQTSYVFSSSENFYKSLELLVKFVQNPYLTDENIEKEKGIIAQEIKMYDDDPGWKVYFNLLNLLYTKHPVKIDIAGTVESINGINKEVLMKSYNTFYNPENMVLFVIGDLDFKKVMNTVNNVDKEFKKTEEVIRLYPEIEEKIANKKIEANMPVPTPIFNLGIKDLDVGYDGEKMIRKDIITNMIMDILFGESSEFYNKMYSRGLIDSSFAGYYTSDKSYGHSIIQGQSSNIDSLMKEIKKYLSEDVDMLLTEEDFKRIKKKTLGNHILSFNSITGIGNRFVDLYFSNFNILEYQRLIESIELEELKERYKSHFDEKYMALSIVKSID